jgi:hypothetical protein
MADPCVAAATWIDSDRKPVVERFQRLGQIALRHQHVANTVVGHRQIVPPAGVAGVGFCQPVGNRKPVAERFQRLGQIAASRRPGLSRNKTPALSRKDGGGQKIGYFYFRG